MKPNVKNALRNKFTLYFWRRFKRLRGYFHIIRGAHYDATRYYLWSHGWGLEKDIERQQRAILKAYHGFEKGMSLPDPRPGFGVEKVIDLIKKIEIWRENFELDDVTWAAIDSLKSYSEFNKARGVSNQNLDAWLAELPKIDKEKLGGITRINKNEIKKKVALGGKDFFLSRHSIRNFSGEKVPFEAIQEAVEIARKTPTVCNRQGPAVYCFEEPRVALQWQPGNRGFGEFASHALVVTCDLRAFSGVGERNQAWIDGGLFSMSIIYALHSLGYGSCPLAWAVPPKTDKRVRSKLNIPDYEIIIMMIAVGCIPYELNVADAYRYPLEKYLRIIPAASRRQEDT